MNHWVKNSSPEENFGEPPVSMPKLLWDVLVSRGYKSDEEIQEIFNPTLKTLSSPFAIDQMEEAVARILEAFVNKEKICIYGDFDLDGTPAIALLKDGLEQLGFEGITYYQPRRLTEGYGLHIEAIDKIKNDGVELIITVDVGVTSLEAVEYCNSIGLNIIITDHHLPKEKLPQAVAVLNPNKGHCPSSLQQLCGTGVAFYLVLGIRVRMRELGLLQNDFNPKSLLDCFAIGTLTDLVPLVRENRILVKHGLIELAKTKRVGLRCLLKELGLWGKSLSSQDVSMRFAPKLNALSRMDKDLLPIDIFLETDEEKAKELVREVIHCNDLRLKKQIEAEQEAESLLGTDFSAPYIFIYSKNFHKGVVGLVATKLSLKYNVPCFIGALNSEGKISGSARRPRESQMNLAEALESVDEYLESSGGHAAAAGFSLLEENVTGFTEKMDHCFTESEQNILHETRFFYDAEGDLADFNQEFMRWYDRMEPFGNSFEAPSFKINNVYLHSLRELKGRHIKLNCHSKDKKLKLEALWFSPPEDHPLITGEFSEGLWLDFIAEPQWNFFKGQTKLQLLIKDVRVSAQ